MTEEYRNSGNLFTPIETSIVRQGRVNVDGVTKNMLIVKSKDREGMEYFNLYFESAKIYKTEKKMTRVLIWMELLTQSSMVK